MAKTIKIELNKEITMRWNGKEVKAWPAVTYHPTPYTKMRMIIKESVSLVDCYLRDITSIQGVPFSYNPHICEHCNGLVGFDLPRRCPHCGEILKRRKLGEETR